MNGRGYSGHYRRQRRRRGLPPVLIIALVTVALLLAIFLIVGNALNNKTQNQPSVTTPANTETEQSKPLPQSVQCFVLDIEGESAYATQTNISKHAESGTRALSVKVKGADGAVLFNSNVAKEFGKQSGSFIEMSTVVSRAKAQGMYVSAYFELDFISEENFDLRTAKLGYEAALVSELVTSGVDDVMISAGEAKSENIPELIRFAENIKAVNKNAKIGIALKSELYAGSESAMNIDSLNAVYDILGIDLSKPPSEGMTEYIEGALSRNLYYILRYNARVILPGLSDAAQANAISGVVSSNSITNYQYVK